MYCKCNSNLFMIFYGIVFLILNFVIEVNDICCSIKVGIYVYFR